MTEKKFVTGFIECLLKSKEFELILQNYIRSLKDQEEEIVLPDNPKAKICEHERCKRLFIPKRDDKRFCTDKCRSDNYANRGKRRWNKETKKWEKA
jgi:hypothetical protein